MQNCSTWNNRGVCKIVPRGTIGAFAKLFHVEQSGRLQMLTTVKKLPVCKCFIIFAFFKLTFANV